jgi:hypothetical protein
MMLALLAALGTVRNPARKSLFPKMLKASIVGWKLTVKILDCVPKVSRNGLSAIHDATNLAGTERDVKG